MTCRSWHSHLLQSPCSLVTPGHERPPLSGAGLLQTRLRDFVPFPQVREQGPHPCHAPQAPSTTKHKTKARHSMSLIETSAKFHSCYFFGLYLRFRCKNILSVFQWYVLPFCTLVFGVLSKRQKGGKIALTSVVPAFLNIFDWVPKKVKAVGQELILSAEADDRHFCHRK